MRLRNLLATATAALTAAGCLTAAGPAHARPDGPRHACSPSVSLDRFSDALDKTTYEGTFVGNLSALAVDLPHSRLRPGGGTPAGSLAALSDRSALLRLDARTLKPEGVVPLADENGAPLDAEGLVVDLPHSRSRPGGKTSAGTYLVASETEPAVRRHASDGRVLHRLPVPDVLRTAPAGRARANGTFEGLTLFPGGHTLLASMEYALTGDDADTVRLQTWRRHRGEFRLGPQHAYRVDPGLGVPEVTALPDGRLLVLERGFTPGVGNTVRLYLADLRRATDTGGIEHLTGRPGVRPAGKTLLADLADCPTLGATAEQPQSNPLLDNIEGMVVTGRDHGRLRVLLVSDDNENPVQTTRFYALRVRV